MTAWLDPSNEADRTLIDSVWEDAPESPAIDIYLASAQDQCEAFAPALADDEEVPDRYKLALILQAQALWNASVAKTGDTFGDGNTVQVFPMDWTVKNLLRPRTGVPVVG